MAKIWTITACFDGGERKRLTFKSEQAFKDAVSHVISDETDPISIRVLSDDYANILIYQAVKLVNLFCAEIWASAEGDMAATREIQLASDEFKKRVETRKALIGQTEGHT